jgi:hypothetical protein
MRSNHDYLEWAFEDLFGRWNPVPPPQSLLQAPKRSRQPCAHQSFTRSFPIPPYIDPDTETLYQHSAWMARLLNRSFRGLQHFPIDGTAIAWCVTLRAAALPHVWDSDCMGRVFTRAVALSHRWNCDCMARVRLMHYACAVCSARSRTLWPLKR